MKRRAVLGTIGSLASLGVIGYATRDPVDALEVRFWLSERAATYPDVVDRISEYLSFALDLEYWSLELTYGGVVAVDTEDGADVTRRGEWPALVAAGTLGRGEIEPVGDVNLLVTDGQMQTAPTGFGMPHVASVGGARYISRLEPLDSLSEPGESVTYSTPNRVMQVLIHEAGHALGLGHDHGVVHRRESTDVATPMLSTYAWDPEYEGDRSRCGAIYPTDEPVARKLSFSFSQCAQREFETYSGGFTP
ncbi:peptidase M10A and M12B matrixin and adamalysin [Natrononativus amylolyticus]|uniref:peptidase M10A and M12B matrixin and adamalysin n=1 Tax=Natrononativus amylolyticus TaxID=2963434 RepID=UPI0020CE2EFF|nr:peptidase M10A and M12B matrixin and adamalysin [Natrononativus amylolyticus]